MDIKLFSLCKQETEAQGSGQKIITDCIKGFFGESEGFAHFTSQKRMLIAATQSLRAADIVLIAVQGNMYNATKRLLSDALDMKLEKSDEVCAILDASFSSGKLKQNIYDANASFPAGAEILPTNDGLNCGFALASGGQHIIFMPIEDEKAGEVAFGSLYDYFNAIAPDGDAMKLRQSRLVRRTAKKLAESDIKVAVADNAAGKLIAGAADAKSLKQSFTFTSDYEEKSEEADEKDYCVETARKIRDNSHANFGAVVSGVLDGEDGEFVYIAVADESGTRAVKVFAEEGEDSQTLADVCVDRLMLMLYNYNRLADPAAVTETDGREDKQLRKILAIVSAAAVGLSAAAGLVAALLVK